MTRTVHLATLLGFVSLCAPALRAQDVTSISPSLSSSYTQNLEEGNLDTNYDEGAGSLGTNLQQGVTDVTHAQIDSSVSGYTAGAYDANSLDTTSYVSPEAPGSQEGEGRSKAIAGEQAFLAGAGSYGVSGFGAGREPAGSSAFRSSIASATAIAPNTTKGAGGGAARASVRETASTTGNSAAIAVDPAYQTALGLVGQEALPGAPAAPAISVSVPYSSPAYTPPEFQYGDGQTPPFIAERQPGVMVPVELTYSVTTTGFPDSTRGEAGLPAEAEVFGPPPALASRVGAAAPFADVSTVGFLPKTGLSPTLHRTSSPGAPERAAAEAQAERLFTQNVLNGMTVNEAEKAKQAEIRSVEEKRRSTLTQNPESLGQAPSGEAPSPVIR